MIIPLKAKYLSAHRGRFQGGEKPDRHGSKKRRKVPANLRHLLVEQPTKRLVVDGGTGKSRMVTR